MKTFPFNKGTRQRCLLSFLFKVVLEVLASAEGLGEKCVSLLGPEGKKIKWPFFSDNVNRKKDSPKASTNKLLGLIREFSKTGEHKMYIFQSYICGNKQEENKILFKKG